jgi:L-alanine-DL-glutamate epimerase-like enolase superfamily enzyme
MKITAVESIVAEIPFRTPFVVWRGEVPAKRHVFVRIATDAGITGWGEAAPFLFYAPETAEGIHAMLETVVAGELLGRDPRDVRRLVGDLAMIDGHLMTKAAVETALWDVLAQAAGLPLYRLLGGAVREAAPLTAIVGHAAPEEMAAEARQWVARGFRSLKIKIGYGIDDDVAMVAAVREAVGPGPRIRVDAEEFYATKQALAAGRALEPLAIELVSQPVPRTDWAGMAFLRQRLPMPLLADEGIHSPADVVTCVASGAADMVNIKVLKSGGLLASLAMAAICRAHHLPVLVGSMIESGIGSLVAAHFAVAEPAVFSTELCGPLLFADDLLDRPLDLRAGAMWLDETPGLGRAPDPAKLDRYRVS